MATLKPGERVWVPFRACEAVVEEVGTNPSYPDRVLVRYERVISERLPMFGVQAFGREWLRPEQLTPEERS